MTDSSEPFPGEIPGSRATINFGEDSPEWKEFYSVLGYCVNQWSYIDRTMFEVCELCLDIDEIKAAIIFYQNTNFEFRKRMVFELVAISLGKDCPKELWKEISSAMEELQKFRNIVAHHPTKQYGEVIWDLHAEGGPKVHSALVRLEIQIEEKELLRGRRKPQTITMNDLMQYSKEITQLHQKLKKFLDVFRNSPTRNKATLPP